MTPHLLLSAAKRQANDDETINTLTRLAWHFGYSLAVHGSRGPKDLDLIAVAWTARAVTHEILIEDFCEQGGLSLSKKPTDQNEKPHGRMAYILVRVADFRIIDISVIPPIKTEQTKLKEASDFTEQSKKGGSYE